MRKRFDHVAIGIGLGLSLPIIALFVYYCFTYRYQTSFTGFVDYFTRLKIIVPAVSLACYASNLPLFFFFIWKERNETAKGILFATIVYTLWVIYEKFLS